MMPFEVKIAITLANHRRNSSCRYVAIIGKLKPCNIYAARERDWWNKDLQATVYDLGLGFIKSEHVDVGFMWLLSPYLPHDESWN